MHVSRYKNVGFWIVKEGKREQKRKLKVISLDDDYDEHLIFLIVNVTHGIVCCFHWKVHLLKRNKIISLLSL